MSLGKRPQEIRIYTLHTSLTKNKQLSWPLSQHGINLLLKNIFATFCKVNSSPQITTLEEA